MSTEMTNETTDNTKTITLEDGTQLSVTPPAGVDEIPQELIEAIQEWAKPLTEEEINETRERVSTARARMLEWTPFFGHLALKLRVIVDKVVPTAAVTPDAKMFVNPRFAKKLTDVELAGLICHEVMHPAFMCFERKGDRDMRLWNQAHDYSINWIITDMACRNSATGRADDFSIVKLPEGGLLSDRFAEKDSSGKVIGYMSTEEIYNKLLEEKQEQEDGEGGGGDGEGGDPGDWGGPGSDLRPDLADDKRPSELEKKRREEFWKVAVVEAAQVNEQSKNKGELSANLKKLIKEILEPRVDWPIVLGRWVGENGKRSDYTYRRPSRRSEAAGALLPSLKKHGVADVVVLWDTSGSMTGRETEIMGEVIGICKDLNMTLRVVACDYDVTADVHDVEEYEDIADAIIGGGGSSFVPAFDLLRGEGWDGVVVAFTDGMIDVPAEMPETFRGTLWVLNEGENPPTNAWGDTLRIGPDGKVSTSGGDN
jgi:predicted metal-dependent peptidase